MEKWNAKYFITAVILNNFGNVYLFFKATAQLETLYIIIGSNYINSKPYAVTFFIMNGILKGNLLTK